MNKLLMVYKISVIIGAIEDNIRLVKAGKLEDALGTAITEERIKHHLKHRKVHTIYSSAKRIIDRVISEL